jgi:hypothetical protein
MHVHARLAVLCLALACGVGSPQWTRPESTQADYDRDSAQCMNAATGASIDPSPGNRARVQSEFDRCMESRGWSRR